MRNHTEIRAEHDRVRAALAAIYDDAGDRALNAHAQERVSKLDS